MTLAAAESASFANCLKLNADKTELLWTGQRYGLTLLGSAGSSLRLRIKTIAANESSVFLA